MDVKKFLENCPDGRVLYSSVFGEVVYEYGGYSLIMTKRKCQDGRTDSCSFFANGTYGEGGECCLFPSKEERDWNNWAVLVQVGDIVKMKDGTLRQFVQCFDRKQIERWATKEECKEYARQNACSWTPKECKVGDPVLAYWNGNSGWTLETFSHTRHVDDDLQVFISGHHGVYCNKSILPFNDQTRHLLGTTEDAPLAFKWWK